MLVIQKYLFLNNKIYLKHTYIILRVFNFKADY